MRPARAILALVVGLALGGCAGPAGTQRPTGTPPSAGSPVTSTARPVGPPGVPSPAASAATSAGPVQPAADGALPQTAASPVAAGADFDTEMASLWQAVVSGDASAALPAFFPLAAYLQVKTVADPAADWRDRLYGSFAADVQAANRLVATGPATLVRVDVPSQSATWVRPGTCANRVGYWHVAGARVVYRAGDTLHSFGIASLISWRGSWYVVHLGAVLRTAPGGVVDRPADGPGTPGPPGGC